VQSRKLVLRKLYCSNL